MKNETVMKGLSYVPCLIHIHNFVGFTFIEIPAETSKQWYCGVFVTGQLFPWVPQMWFQLAQDT